MGMFHQPRADTRRGLISKNLQRHQTDIWAPCADGKRPSYGLVSNIDPKVSRPSLSIPSGSPIEIAIGVEDQGGIGNGSWMVLERMHHGQVPATVSRP